MIGEAIGGLRYLTNHAECESNLPPVRVGISIGDAVAGIYAAVDNDRGVWKAPANVSLSSVLGLTRRIDNKEQENTWK